MRKSRLCPSISPTYRAKAAEEVRRGVVGEVAAVQQEPLDGVVEAELAHSHEHGPARGPVGAAEQLAEALLAVHAKEAVDGVLVAAEEARFITTCWFLHSL